MAESMANLPPDVNKGPMELGIAITLTVLALIQVGLRLHTRIFVSRAMGWDDWLAAASMVWASIRSSLIVRTSSHSPSRPLESYRSALTAYP